MTKQTFSSATSISCDNNPQKVIPLDFNIDEHYVETLQLVLRATALLFELKQFQSATSPQISTEQDVRTYSNAEFTKHSDTTLKFFRKSISIDLLATFEKQPIDFNSFWTETDLILTMFGGSTHMITF